MKGAQAYDCKGFHGSCPDVDVVEVGGIAYLYCRRCRVLANLQAVSPKFESYAEAALERTRPMEVTHAG